MKHLFKAFVCLLAVSMSTQAMARETFDTSNEESSTDGDLSKMDAAKLTVRLGWAKAYLADLEKNDKVMGTLGVPVEVSPLRTAYAVGVTAVNASLIGATYALAHKAVKQTIAGRAAMRSEAVQTYRGLAKAAGTTVKTTPRLARRGMMPVGSAPSAEIVAKAKDVFDLHQANVRVVKENLKYTNTVRAFRAAGITLGVGVVATLIYDGVRTWMQVRHNGQQVEEQKQNLRDFIAYAEERLSNNDESAQSEDASFQAAE